MGVSTYRSLTRDTSENVWQGLSAEPGTRESITLVAASGTTQWGLSPHTSLPSPPPEIRTGEKTLRPVKKVQEAQRQQRSLLRFRRVALRQQQGAHILCCNKYLHSLQITLKPQLTRNLVPERGYTQLSEEKDK